MRVMLERLKRPPIALIAAAGALASAAEAQAPEREENVIVYGDDPCPTAQDEEEIVVCARRPEEERYRIPEPLREREELRERSWTSQAMQLEDAQRDSRPNSCSVVGSHGQSGCRQQMLREWADWRRSRRPER